MCDVIRIGLLREGRVAVVRRVAAGQERNKSSYVTTKTQGDASVPHSDDHCGRVEVESGMCGGRVMRKRVKRRIRVFVWWC